MLRWEVCQGGRIDVAEQAGMLARYRDFLEYRAAAHLLRAADDRCIRASEAPEFLQTPGEISIHRMCFDDTVLPGGRAFHRIVCVPCPDGPRFSLRVYGWLDRAEHCVWVLYIGIDGIERSLAATDWFAGLRLADLPPA